MVNPDGPRNKDNKLQFIEDSDFNFVYKSVNDGAAQGTSTYTVAKGDTLQSIARSQLGDADLWFTIAQANGLADSAELEVGQVLRIPAVVVTSTNNDDGTFEAYDPTAIIGDTTPVIPQPPKKKKNILKQIIIIVAAVVAVVLTAGALAAPAGTLASSGLGGIFSAGLSSLGAGLSGVGLVGSTIPTAAVAGTTALGATGWAIAGAVGSIAGQVTAMALGEQDKFSWKQVGLSALGSVIGAGLPSFVSSPVANAVIKGAVGNTISQGIGVATGLQESFSWRAVAASAVGAGIGQAVGGALNNNASALGPVQPAFSSLGNVGGTFARGLVSGLAAGAAANVVMSKGGKIDLTRVAADAFGNALGNSIVGQLSQPSQQAGKAPQTQGQGPWSDYGYQNGADIADSIAREQARAGFIAAGRDMMGPESGVWDKQADFERSSARNGGDVDSDNYRGGRRTITIEPGKGLLGSMASQGYSTADRRALMGQLDRYKQLGGLNPSELQAGQQFYADLDDLTAADGRRGGALISRETAQRVAAARAAENKAMAAQQATNADEVQRLVNRAAVSQSQGYVAAGAASGVDLIPRGGYAAPAHVPSVLDGMPSWVNDGLRNLQPLAGLGGVRGASVVAAKGGAAVVSTAQVLYGSATSLYANYRTYGLTAGLIAPHLDKLNNAGVVGAELAFGYDAVAPSAVLPSVASKVGNVAPVGGSERLVQVYRGTNLGAENSFYAETGHLLSDAARQSYGSTGSVTNAYKSAESVHEKWIDIWGSESQYVQAHGAFGLELPQAFNMDRTFISVTTDLNAATYFSQGGMVYGGLVPESMLLRQTLVGAGESEFLLRLGTKALKPIPGQ
jgi:hypothetical protein